MRQILAFLLVAAFLGVAVFGFAAMGHGEGHSRGVCVAAASQAAPCPEDGPVAWAFFHVSAFKGFSSAVASVVLLVVAALAAFAGLSIPIGVPAGAAPVGSLAAAILDSIAVSSKRMTAWLAIFEKRDPVAFPQVRARGLGGEIG